MTRILIHDTFGGVSPSFIATQRVGGSHMHLAQVAEYLASHGIVVHCYHKGPSRSEESGVHYFNVDEYEAFGRPDMLLIVGNSDLPKSVQFDRAYAFQVIDPRPVPHLFDHLRGKPITMVCVSEWQAGLFRDLGFETVVIPVPIPDEWYDSPRPMHGRPIPKYDFGCFSSWNKGAQETIDAWDSSWGTLAVGSPYSHPDLVPMTSPRDGVTWLGSLNPRDRWLWAMCSVHDIARICTIGETFGVVDVAARAMGKSVYTLCTGDVGALREVGARPFTDPAEWREAIRQRVKHPGGDADAYRLSNVMPQWLELVRS